MFEVTETMRTMARATSPKYVTHSKESRFNSREEIALDNFYSREDCVFPTDEDLRLCLDVGIKENIAKIPLTKITRLQLLCDTVHSFLTIHYTLTNQSILVGFTHVRHLHQLSRIVTGENPWPIKSTVN